MSLSVTVTRAQRGRPGRYCRAFVRSTEIASNCSSAARTSSAISATMTSGAGRFAESSREWSFSQGMSRLNQNLNLALAGRDPSMTPRPIERTTAARGQGAGSLAGARCRLATSSR